MSASRKVIVWGVKDRCSDKNIDGQREQLLSPVPWGYYHGAVFRTRAEARKFINDKFGYIRTRPDLRAHPHGWLMPQAVRVELSLREVEEGA